MGSRPSSQWAQQFMMASTTLLGLACALILSGRADAFVVGGRHRASSLRLLAPPRSPYSKSPSRFQLLASTDASGDAGATRITMRVEDGADSDKDSGIADVVAQIKEVAAQIKEVAVSILLVQTKIDDAGNKIESTKAALGKEGLSPDQREILVMELKSLMNKEAKLLDEEQTLRDEKKSLVRKEESLMDEKKSLVNKEAKLLDEEAEKEKTLMSEEKILQ